MTNTLTVTEQHLVNAADSLNNSAEEMRQSVEAIRTRLESGGPFAPEDLSQELAGLDAAVEGIGGVAAALRLAATGTPPPNGGITALAGESGPTDTLPEGVGNVQPQPGTASPNDAALPSSPTDPNLSASEIHPGLTTDLESVPSKQPTFDDLPGTETAQIEGTQTENVPPTQYPADYDVGASVELPGTFAEVPASEINDALNNEVDTQIPSDVFNDSANYPKTGF